MADEKKPTKLELLLARCDALENALAGAMEYIEELTSDDREQAGIVDLSGHRRFYVELPEEP